MALFNGNIKAAPQLDRVSLITFCVFVVEVRLPARGVAQLGERWSLTDRAEVRFSAELTNTTSTSLVELHALTNNSTI